MTTRLIPFALLIAAALFSGCAKSSDTPATAAAAAAKHEVTNFATDVIARSQTTPVVVDFWASWCGPCKMLKPTLEKAAGEADDRWKLVAVNVDNHGPLAEQYGIRSIPNVKLFHQGKVVAEFVGVKSEADLKSWLDANLPNQARSPTS